MEAEENEKKTGKDSRWECPQPAQCPEGPLAPHTQCPPGVSQEPLLRGHSETCHGCSKVAEGMCKIRKAKHLLRKSCGPRTSHQGKAKASSSSVCK